MTRGDVYLPREITNLGPIKLVKWSSFIYSIYLANTDAIIQSDINEWISSLRSDSSSVNRRLAADAIAENAKHINPEIVVPTLRFALYDADPRVRLAAVIALNRFAESSFSAVQLLVEALTDQDPSVRVMSARSLGDTSHWVGRQREIVIGGLATVLHDDREAVRCSAAKSLLRLQGTGVSRSVIDILKKCGE